jgi:hypothetical protein
VCANVCQPCEVIIKWIKVYKVLSEPWGLSDSPTSLRSSDLVYYFTWNNNILHLFLKECPFPYLMNFVRHQNTTRESSICPWANFSFVSGIFAPGTNESICTGWGEGGPEFLPRMNRAGELHPLPHEGGVEKPCSPPIIFRSYRSRALIISPPTSEVCSKFSTVKEKWMVLVIPARCWTRSLYNRIIRNMFFFANYIIHRRHSQRTHTHPYEYTHANPTPRSIFEDCAGKSSRLTKSPQAPRCRRERRLLLKAQTPLNPEKFAPTRSRTQNLRCYRDSCNH